MRTNLDEAEGLERIVKAALAELPLSGAILLGPGAATRRLADMLPADLPLTVVTNAVSIAQTLASRPDVTVVLLGGRLDPRTGAAVDPWARDHLEQVHTEVAFVVPDGVSVRRGLTMRDVAGAAMHASMLRTTLRTVVLADRSRVGTDHMARFAEVADVDVVITEWDLDDDTAAGLAARGPRVVRV